MVCEKELQEFLKSYLLHTTIGLKSSFGGLAHKMNNIYLHSYYMKKLNGRYQS